MGASGLLQANPSSIIYVVSTAGITNEPRYYGKYIVLSEFGNFLLVVNKIIHLNNLKTIKNLRDFLKGLSQLKLINS